MSNRTLMEFNHDYAGVIKDSPDMFAAAILCYLQTGNTGLTPKMDLSRFGVEVLNMRHHSEERKLP